MPNDIKNGGYNADGSKAAWVWLILLMFTGAFYAYCYNHYV